MSDVGAVVLTLGEPTTTRALRSLEAQTLTVDDVVVVEGVKPFHRALNSGADRVATPFFVQVDADMVLDPECVEVLRDGMHPAVGIGVGALRDPLAGTIPGVKMFRRSCFDALRLRDTIAPEIDFYVTLGRLGWLTQGLIGHGARSTRTPTLGQHRPEYTVDYVFGTYYMLGRKHAHREDARALRWRFTQLRGSAHAMTPVARLAMAHGILGSESRDMAKPLPTPADSSFLCRLVASPEDASEAPGRTRRLLTGLAPGALFEAFRDLGASLRTVSQAGLRACLRLVGETEHPRSLLAEVALGHGALATSPPARTQIPVGLERLADAWASEASWEHAA